MTDEKKTKPLVNFTRLSETDLLFQNTMSTKHLMPGADIIIDRNGFIRENRDKPELFEDIDSMSQLLPHQREAMAKLIEGKADDEWVPLVVRGRVMKTTVADLKITMANGDLSVHLPETFGDALDNVDESKIVPVRLTMPPEWAYTQHCKGISSRIETSASADTMHRKVQLIGRRHGPKLFDNPILDTERFKLKERPDYMAYGLMDGLDCDFLHGMRIIRNRYITLKVKRGPRKGQRYVKYFNSADRYQTAVMRGKHRPHQVAGMAFNIQPFTDNGL